MRAFLGLARVLGTLVVVPVGMFLRAGPKAKLVVLCIIGVAMAIGCVATHNEAVKQDKQTARVEQQWYEQNKRESERLAHKHYNIPEDCQTTTTNSIKTTSGKHAATSTTNTVKRVCK